MLGGRMGSDQQWYVSTQHLLRATGGGATSWASEASKSKDVGRSMKRGRVKEGGRRKILALEQIPAYLRLTEANSQPLPSAKETTPQGP